MNWYHIVLVWWTQGEGKRQLFINRSQLQRYWATANVTCWLTVACNSIHSPWTFDVLSWWISLVRCTNIDISLQPLWFNTLWNHLLQELHLQIFQSMSRPALYIKLWQFQQLFLAKQLGLGKNNPFRKMNRSVTPYFSLLMHNSELHKNIGF